MNATFTRIVCVGALLLGIGSAGCGDLVRQGRGPSQIVIMSLEAASGNDPEDLSSNLQSDVVTNVMQTENGAQVMVPTIFNDVGEVTMSLLLKDPGQPGLATTPSAINQITITRYRVTYERADGRNVPGVDVPYAFDGAATFTIPAEGTVTAGFEIVRHAAKMEAPLRALRDASVVISTIGHVTFYGRDQAGNEVSATGSIQIDFANFGDES